MDRRSALKNIVLASGGLITLPIWMGCGTNDTPVTHQSSFSAAEQQLLAAVSDTIIPAGGSIGALAMGVDKFLQKLLDDCYEKDIQDNVKKQLKALNRAAKEAYGTTFPASAPGQRKALLMKFAGSADKEEKEFFTLLRSETIRGFNTSKEVMLKYLGYKIAPGHYYGCIDVKA